MSVLFKWNPRHVEAVPKHRQRETQLWADTELNTASEQSQTSTPSPYSPSSTCVCYRVLFSCLDPIGHYRNSIMVCRFEHGQLQARDSDFLEWAKTPCPQRLLRITVFSSELPCRVLVIEDVC
jgi:hypothetical protein